MINLFLLVYALEAQQVLSKTVVIAGSVEKPEDIFNFGFAHEEQVKLVHSCQDALLKKCSMDTSTPALF